MSSFSFRNCSCACGEGASRSNRSNLPASAAFFSGASDSIHARRSAGDFHSLVFYPLAGAAALTILLAVVVVARLYDQLELHFVQRHVGADPVDTNVKDVDVVLGEQQRNAVELARLVVEPEAQVEVAAGADHAVLDDLAEQIQVDVATGEHQADLATPVGDLPIQQRGQADGASALDDQLCALHQQDDGLGDRLVLDGDHVVDQVDRLSTARYVPQAIWIAAWNDTPNIYGFGDPPCPLPDALWNNHQRVHQYRGAHDETWGGVTINIDSNAVDGPTFPLSPR